MLAPPTPSPQTTIRSMRDWERSHAEHGWSIGSLLDRSLGGRSCVQLELSFCPTWLELCIASLFPKGLPEQCGVAPEATPHNSIFLNWHHIALEGFLEKATRRKVPPESDRSSIELDTRASTQGAIQQIPNQPPHASLGVLEGTSR